MNIKLKMTFVIIITLALGIAIGAMVNRTLSQNRIKSILSKRRSDIFVTTYKKILQPNASQRELIREILYKYANRVTEIQTNFREDMESSIESMRAELDPILTPEQKKRFERGLPLRGRQLLRPRFQTERNIDEKLQALKEALGLSEDQASQVKQILEESRGQAVKMREERDRFRGGWQTMRELEEKKEKAIEKILTEKQKKLYEQMKKERRKKMEKEWRERREIIREHGF